ncbi:RHS repeat-associated core domain-containing protein [Symmachiella dynata]|uniref:RHS repeat-associated core domain-containing protein n=1 Tax=Symmachiella dynata TaxID=2527995 RepID=UPI0030ECE436
MRLSHRNKTQQADVSPTESGVRWHRFLPAAVFAMFMLVVIMPGNLFSEGSGGSTPTKTGNDGDDNCNTGACEKCEEGNKCPGAGVAATDCPIYLRKGSVIEDATDLFVPGPGIGWSLNRSYNSSGTGASSLGNRWLNEDADMYLYQSGANISLQLNAFSQLLFTSSGSTYSPPDDTSLTLEHDSGAKVYIVTNTNDNMRYVFNDFTVTNAAHRGLLIEKTTLQWSSAYTGLEYLYDASGLITQIITADGQGYSIVFTYSGTVITKIEVKDGATVLQEVEYTYYGDVTSPSTDIGSSGDLVQVKVSRDASDDTPGDLSIVRYTQYRYDSNSRLKAIFDHGDIQRTIASDGGISSAADILSEDDDYGTPDVETFAGRRFTYYASNTATSNIATPFDGMGEDLNTLYGGTEASEANFAKSETIGAGCSSCGSSNAGLTKTYFYLYINQGVPSDQNEVTRLVIEDTEDADGTAVYRTIWGLNEDGRQLRKVFIEDPTGTPNYWCESWTLATSGKEARIAEYRLPSAHDVTSAGALRNYLDPFDDVAPSWSNDTNTLNSSEGLINIYGYNSDGSRTDHKVKKGRTGTEYYVGAWDYGDGDGDSAGDDYDNNTLLVATYSYPTQTTTRADGKKTSYGYTFWDTDDSEVKTKTTTLPVISTGQNGSGVATTTVEYYGDLGQLRWTQDGEGYINYYSYNPVTGGQAYVAVDVDPASPGSDVTSGSSGNWRSWDVDNGNATANKPTRGGSLPTALNLVTKTYYDDQGRQIRTVDNGGAEHYTAYPDLRTIHFPYWTGSTTLMPIQVRQFNEAGQLTQSFFVKAGYTSITTSSGAPVEFSGTDPGQSDYVSWTRNNYASDTGRLESVDRYHDIPTSGDGTLSTNYYRTITQYDPMGRVEYTIQVVSGSSATDRKEQVTQNAYDIRDRVIEIKMGVSGDSASNSHSMTDDYDTYPTLRTISKTEYDDGGVGDGYLTKIRRYFGTGSDDFTGGNYFYTYRGHWRGVEPFYGSGGSETSVSPSTVLDANWLGQVISAAAYDTDVTWSTVLTGDGYSDYASSNSTNRRTLAKTYYDDLNRLYRFRHYEIDATEGTGSDYAQIDYYYDRSSRRVGVQPAHAAATETAYDGAGRAYQTRTVIDLESTKYSSGAFQYRAPVPKQVLSLMSGGDDLLLTLDHSIYESNNVIERHTFEDNHDDAVSVTRGIDLTNNDDYVRRSVYSWYGDADRVEVTADYGSGDTTAGAGTWKYAAVPSRPGTAPAASSGTKLVTLYGYNSDSGRLETVTDPAVIVTKSFYDDLGRTNYVVENYDNFNASTEANTGDSTDKSKDRVTKFTYNGLDEQVALVAMDANADGTLSDNQTKTYLFEDTVNASLATNQIYPDSADTTSAGSDQVKYQFNIDGSLSKKADHRGDILDYTYTNRRQLELTKVTTLGGSTDGHVRSIKKVYDDLARLEKVTSYSNSDGAGSVRNEIKYEYNDLSQITASHQSHDGVVSVGSTPKVQYTYDAAVTSNVFTRQHRLESMTYPDGRVIYYDYDSANPDYPASRLSQVKKIRETDDSGTILSKYDYSGDRMLAIIDLPQPDIKLDYFQGASGTYAGYDRFGRVKDQYWKGYGSTSDVDRFKYNYDYAGNRTYRDIDIAIYSTDDRDQADTYDGLHRLKTSNEGKLSGSTIAGTPANEEDWTLDALGNWSGYLTKTNGTTGLNQSRTTNEANEISDVTESIGPSWSTPTYDASGNMTTVPKPGDPTLTYTATYDAFNRLVKVENGANIVAEYEYDGLNRRIVKIDKSGMNNVTYDYYLNENWQNVEIRRNGDTDPYEQFVWHHYYIDALLLRDFDEDTDGNAVRQYYIHDANMNVTTIVDDAGAAQERYHYRLYGNPIILDANFAVDSDGVSDIQNSITFTGRFFDSETGLAFYRNRYYHPVLGIFLSRDPIEEGWNFYSYVGNKPSQYVDPFGTTKQVCERKAVRVEIKVPKVVLQLGKKFGLHDVKAKLHGEYKKCWECCEDTGDRPSQTKGGLALGVVLVGEAGTPEVKFWKVSIRIGWYFRFSGSGSGSVKWSKCSGEHLAVCFSVSGELGIIADAKVGDFGVGVRTGGNVSATVCLRIGHGGSVLVTANVCAGLRFRTWVKGKIWWGWKVEYFWEASTKACTGHRDLFGIGT